MEAFADYGDEGWRRFHTTLEDGLFTMPPPTLEDLDKRAEHKVETVHEEKLADAGSCFIADCQSYSSNCSAIEKREEAKWLSAKNFWFQFGDKNVTLMDKLTRSCVQKQIVAAENGIGWQPLTEDELKKLLEPAVRTSDVSVDVRRKRRPKRKEYEDFEEIEDLEQRRIEKRKAKNRRTAKESRDREKLRYEQLERENEILKKENEMLRSNLVYRLSLLGAFSLNPRDESAALAIGIELVILLQSLADFRLDMALTTILLFRVSFTPFEQATTNEWSAYSNIFAQALVAVRWSHMICVCVHSAVVAVQEQFNGF